MKGQGPRQQVEASRTQAHPLDSRYSILFPRHFGTARSDTAHRQEAQVVQPQLTLDDSLP